MEMARKVVVAQAASVAVVLALISVAVALPVALTALKAVGGAFWYSSNRMLTAQR